MQDLNGNEQRKTSWTHALRQVRGDEEELQVGQVHASALPDADAKGNQQVRLQRYPEMRVSTDLLSWG